MVLKHHACRELPYAPSLPQDSAQSQADRVTVLILLGRKSRPGMAMELAQDDTADKEPSQDSNAVKCSKLKVELAARLHGMES